MIIVAVGHEDEVKWRELFKCDSGRLKPGKQEGNGPGIDGIGQDVDAIQPYQNARVVNDGDRACHTNDEMILNTSKCCKLV
jgi:hypothetical protein